MQVGLLADEAAIDSYVGCSRGDALNYPGPSSGRPSKEVPSRVAPGSSRNVN